MGSRITRAIDRNQRSAPVVTNSVPQLIQTWILSLSSIAAFCIGYLIVTYNPHNHYSSPNQYYEIDKYNYQRLLLNIICFLILCIIKINNVLFRASLALFIFIWMPDYLSQNLKKCSLFIIIYGLWLILYGQLFKWKTGAGIWIFLFQIIEYFGQKLGVALKVSSKHKNTLLIEGIFGFILVMCVVLICSGLVHTKTKHVSPIHLNRLVQYFKNCQKKGLGSIISLQVLTSTIIILVSNTKDSQLVNLDHSHFTILQVVLYGIFGVIILLTARIKSMFKNLIIIQFFLMAFCKYYLQLVAESEISSKYIFMSGLIVQSAIITCFFQIHRLLGLGCLLVVKPLTSLFIHYFIAFNLSDIFQPISTLICCIFFVIIWCKYQSQKKSHSYQPIIVPQ